MKGIVSIALLGPVTVTVNGAPPPPPLLWKKPLALLLYLARSPRRTRSRDHLLGLLWPERTDAKARGSLNESLRLLRAHGGRTLIASVGDQVRLDPRRVELDVDVFEAFVAQERWAEAAALVGGEFLEGFAIAGASGVDEWLRLEREQWRRTCVDVFAHLSDQLSESGNPAGAVAPAERALALDPNSDPAVRALMRALARRGQRNAALQAFEAFGTRLFEALGTKPEPETIGLAERITAGRMGVKLRSDEPAADSSRAPLTGRSPEMARMLRAWRACVRRRRASAALILGDPGTGKTRLAEEVLITAALEGAVIAATRAVEADLADPWSGFLSLAGGELSGAPGVAAAAPAALATLAARVPAFAERFPGTRSGELSVAKAFAHVVRAICDARPLVLLLDDAQWTDRESLLATGALLRDVAQYPCFVIISASVHPPRVEVAALGSRIGRGVPGLTVTLKPLAVDDLRALARAALPAYDAVQIDRVTRRIATDSAGLPLLATELLRAVASGLELMNATSAWPEPLKTLHQTYPAALPDAVAAAITVNYRRLSKDAQQVAATVAALGGRVSVASIRRAVKLDAGALNSALDELEWTGWLESEARGYAFVARVVEQMVEQKLMSKGERTRIRSS